MLSRIDGVLVLSASCHADSSVSIASHEMTDISLSGGLLLVIGVVSFRTWIVGYI